MTSKTLIAGPWVGEFGWELFAWQAYVRSLSRKYDQTAVICRPSSTALYQDFATQFIDVGTLSGLADSYYMYGVDMSELLKEKMQAHRELIKDGTTLLIPKRIGNPPFTPCTLSARFGTHDIVPEYITFGAPSDIKYDYIFHIRNRQLRKEDNWSLESWEKLLLLLTEDGSTVACVGTVEESSWIKGTTDHRATPLSDVFSMFHSARCVFGPSSGPMHLASLCGTPHVVWSKEGNRERYQKNWNPLETPVLFLSEYGWHPSAQHVHQKFMIWEKK